jgi:hypothetical protein
MKKSLDQVNRISWGIAMESYLKESNGCDYGLKEAIRDGAAADWREDLCLCVPHLIELMESAHNRPMSDSRDAIRSVVADYCMRGDLGEMHEGGSVMLEVHVKLLVKELEKCRRVRIDKGNWSDAPIPPQMFG